VASIKHFRGDTFLRSWVLKDSNGNPIDLTDATARLHLRDAEGVLVVEATTENGSIVIDEEFGRINLRLDAADMVLEIATFKFDIELTHANGVVKTLEKNNIQIMEDITYD